MRLPVVYGSPMCVLLSNWCGDDLYLTGVYSSSSLSSSVGPLENSCMCLPMCSHVA